MGATLFYARFEKNEDIDRIEFTIKEESDAPQVSARVCFVGSQERKKLSSGDIVTVNDQPMKGESFNNGTSSGYSYKLLIDKAPLYELKVVHNGKETKQTVKPQPFSASLPSSISISKDLEIPFKSSSEFSGKAYIEISSIGKKDPILKNDKYQRALTLRSSESESKLVISHEQLKNIKLGFAELSVSRIFGHSYLIEFRKDVEIKN